MDNDRALFLELQDTEWPLTYSDHDRQIVRAIVVDDSDQFYFVRAVRDDEFGAATLIETSGGGVEPGETLRRAILRELREELGAEVTIIRKIGIVSDYYNLIHRHNINHYFLCRIKTIGDRQLTPDEAEQFHLSTLRLSYDEAVGEYERRMVTPLGRLIANRELPILKRAKELLDDPPKPLIWCFGDSNTYGYDPRGFFGGRYAEPWPELLAAATGFQVINDGKNGRKVPATSFEISQFRRDAEKYAADRLIVMLGTNDLLHGATADEIAAWMGAFLIQCDVPLILLIAPPPMKRGEWVPDDKLVAESRALAYRYKELAEQLNIGYAGGWEADLAFDGVHFSEAGHATFAGKLAEVLNDLKEG